MTIDQLGANTSCLANFTLGNAIGQIRKLGFRGIALLAYPNTRCSHGDLAGFWFRQMSDQEHEALKSLIANFRRCAIHAPFADHPLFSYDPRVEQLSRDRVEEAIDAASYLGAQVVTVHANPKPNFTAHEYWNEMVDTLRSLGWYALDRGVRIGVETGYPDRTEQMVDLLEAIALPSVGVTLDVGHAIRYVGRDPRGTTEAVELLNQQLVDMIRQLGPLVIHCHIHDVLASDWSDHRAVGRGVIDFRRLLQELQTSGYEGMLELELEEDDQVNALVESKRRLESLLLPVRHRTSASRRAA